MLEAHAIDSVISGFTPPEPASARFSTHDRDECLTYISNTSIGHNMKPNSGRDSISFLHWSVHLDCVDIDMVEVDCEFSIDRSDVDDRYYVHLPLDGTCEISGGNGSAVARAGHIFALNPSNQAHKRWVGGCRQMMLRIDRLGIERIMADDLGVECHEPLDFAPVVLGGASNMALARFLMSYWNMFATGAGMHQKHVAKSLECGLVSGILAVLPHNYSAELQRPVAAAAPYYVRRAIDFIHANVRNNISPQDLVTAAGVSARSLYYGFRRWRGTTPMIYLRNVRLALARKELEAARSTGGSVTEIALNVGYEHLSRFSKDYRDKYGELPSATLRG